MEKKKEYGQFMTTRYKYILQGFQIPENITKIIEPFAGNCDLINFLGDKEYLVECYDIEPKKPSINKRDSLMNPPIYKDKFLITNPPYLARNKSQNKGIFDKYNMNDLYKCHIKTICDDTPLGGILIIPLNFWSSIRDSDIELRKLFLSKFNVLRLNIFEERVFDDTSYTICSFLFELKENDSSNNILIHMFPSNETFYYSLDETNNYLIGGHIYHLDVGQNKYNITRLTKANKKETANITNILVKCLDDDSESKISLSIVKDADRFIDETANLSARSYATLVISPPINMERQKKLVEDFNKFLNKERDQYHSLFLTNYRESKDIARKRISFSLVYLIVSHLLQ